ncbi:MAG: HEAT repeat domain-containing protein [Planctomycetes bacterium]|nr:HEAT repeat domain-containing protein [Planctomycetota bacterium]
MQASAPKPLTAERMLAIATRFEKQGQPAHAREVYEQLLAADPNSPIARERLDTLIAASQGAEAGSRRRIPPRPSSPHPLAEIATGEEHAANSAMSTEVVHVAVTAAAPVRVVDTATPPAEDVDLAPYEHPLASTPAAEPSASSQAGVDVPPSPTGRQEKINEDEWEFPAVQSATASSAKVQMDVVEAAESTTLVINALPEMKEPDQRLSADGPSLPETADAAQSSAVESANDSRRIDETAELIERSEIPAQLQQLFGPFHAGMLEYVSEHRGEIQDGLLGIACDPAANPMDRSRANFLLGQIGPDAAAVVEGLRRTMRSVPVKSLQIEMAESILLIQPGDSDAVRLLLSILREKGHDDSRFYAAFALRASASPTTGYVVDELLDVLAETDDCRLRRMIMLSLGSFGTAAEKAIPALRQALDDPDPMARVIADSSLKVIAPQPDGTRQVRYQVSDLTVRGSR